MHTLSKLDFSIFFLHLYTSAMLSVTLYTTMPQVFISNRCINYSTVPRAPTTVYSSHALMLLALSHQIIHMHYFSSDYSASYTLIFSTHAAVILQCLQHSLVFFSTGISLYRACSTLPIVS